MISSTSESTDNSRLDSMEEIDCSSGPVRVSPEYLGNLIN